MFMKLDMMSNAEINVYMKEMEFEYEALKTKVKQDIEKMAELDKKYSQALETLQKRSYGKI